MMDLENKLIDMLLKLDWSRDVNASNRFLNASTAREESIMAGSLAEGTSTQVAELCGKGDLQIKFINAMLYQGFLL